MHLMIAGRCSWNRRSKPPGKIALALFEFDSGTLPLTEAGTKRRASLHLVQGEEALTAHRPRRHRGSRLDPASVRQRA